MADETKRFIIQTIYDSEGLKDYATDLENARAVSEKFGVDVSNSAKLLEQATTASFTKNDEVITRTTALIEDKGQKIKVVYDQMGENVRAVSATTLEYAGNNNVLGNELTKLVSRAVLVIPVWLALRAAFTGVLDIISSSIKFLVEWETQMAQIRLVSSASAQEMSNLSSQLLTLSSNYGIANKDIGDAAKIFLQQGTAIKDLGPLMDATAKLSLITGQTMTAAVSDLTAVMKAYNLQSSQAISIVDSLANVERLHAISATDLSNALKQVSSSAVATGTSLSGLVGYITAIESQTRDTGDKVGTTLKSMFDRITTTSAQSLQSLTGVPFYLDETGKATTTVTPVMRNLDSILGELSITYKGLTNAQKLQVDQLVGGTRNLNQAAALFNNFNESVQVQADSLFSLGKADEAVGILTDTMENRIKKLTGAWDEFIGSVANTDALKGATGLLTGLIEGASSIINPEDSQRKDALNQLGQNEQTNSRQQAFADALLQVQKQASDLNDVLERNPKAIDDARARTAIWASEINEVGKNFGITIDKTVTTPKQLVDSLTAQLDQIRNLKITGALDNIKNQIKSELINDTTDIQKIINGSINEDNASFLDPKKFQEASQVLQQFTQGIDTLTKEQGDKLKAAFSNFISPKDFQDLSKLIDNVIKSSQQLNDVDSRRSALLQDEIDKEKQSNAVVQSKILTEDQLNDKLRQIERDGITNGTSQLNIVNQEVALLQSQGDQLVKGLQTRLQTLETQQVQLEVAKKNADLQAQENIALNELKLNGASQLQILIQELAFMNQIGAKDEEISKKRQQIAIEEQNVQAQAQQALSDYALQTQKTQGSSEAQIIAERMELEKRLGIQKDGLDALKEQLQLLQAINKEHQTTPEQRLGNLARAIRTQQQNSDPFGFQSASYNFRAQQLSSQARFSGLSDDQINNILNPDQKFKSLLSPDLQDFAKNSDLLGGNIDKLARAIESLAQNVVKDAGTPLNPDDLPLIPSRASSNSSVTDTAIPNISRGQALNVGGTPMIQISIGNTSVYLNQNADNNTIAQAISSQLDRQNAQRKAEIISEVARQLRTPGTDLNKADKNNFQSF